MDAKQDNIIEWSGRLLGGLFNFSGTKVKMEQKGLKDFYWSLYVIKAEGGVMPKTSELQAILQKPCTNAMTIKYPFGNPPNRHLFPKPQILFPKIQWRQVGRNG